MPISFENFCNKRKYKRRVFDMIRTIQRLFARKTKMALANKHDNMFHMIMIRTPSSSPSRLCHKPHDNMFDMIKTNWK